MQFIKKNYIYFILFLIVLIHLPFLNSDPDIAVDKITRGAFTDEGLYTSQIKNFINSGIFNLYENKGALIFAPFFNLMIFPFLLVFGKKLIVTRLFVLLFSLFSIYIFSKNKTNKVFVPIILILALLEFHVFQFSHYGISEIVCTNFIFLSMYFFQKYYESDFTKAKYIAISSLFIFLAYSTKIQYYYAIALLPLNCTFFVIISIIKNKKANLKQLTPLAYSVAFSFVFFILFFLIFVLPNFELVNKAFYNIYESRFPTTYLGLKNVVSFNLKNVLWRNDLKLYLAHFAIIVFLAFFYYFKHRTKNKFIVPIAFSAIWILIELQKLTLSYLPTRYLLGLIFAIGIFVSSFYAEIYYKFKKARVFILIIIFILGIYNLQNIYQAIDRRTFNIDNANNYLSNYNLKNQVILGDWAPSLTWKSNAISIPYENDLKNPLKSFSPRIIITESDQEDCCQAYKLKKINLDSISDSSRTFRIWIKDVKLYWIKKEFRSINK